MSDFLPAGYEHHKKKSRYIKVSELPEGDHKYRIMQSPICGYMEWKDGKPCRYRSGKQPKVSHDEGSPIHEFWDMYVWCYKQGGLFILQAKQAGVIKGLIALGEDEDWGNFMEYDIKLTKKGMGGKARYSMMGLPHKPVTQTIIEALNNDPCDLEMIFEGKDPWTGQIPKKEVTTPPSDAALETLKQSLEKDGLDPEPVGSYIEERAMKSKKPFAKVIEAALLMFPEFKARYKEWLDLYDQPSEALPF